MSGDNTGRLTRVHSTALSEGLQCVCVPELYKAKTERVCRSTARALAQRITSVLLTMFAAFSIPRCLVLSAAALAPCSDPAFFRYIRFRSSRDGPGQRNCLCLSQQVEQSHCSVRMRHGWGGACWFRHQRREQLNASYNSSSSERAPALSHDPEYAGHHQLRLPCGSLSAHTIGRSAELDSESWHRMLRYNSERPALEGCMRLQRYTVAQSLSCQEP